MAATIEIDPTGTETSRRSFRVTVREGSGATQHRVTLDNAYFERLAGPGELPDAFVLRCFEFLLEREPKESILSSFDVSVIARYFGEFERTIGHETG